jgi:hypothetical protein
MSPLTDEDALREALHDLTAAQPASPVERMTGVRRRHRRRRAVQSVAGVLSLAVVTAGVVAGVRLVGTSTGADLASRGPSWALPWPDHRDGSVPQSVLDGAVTAWRYLGDGGTSSQPLPQPRQVIWYVGQRVRGTDDVAVVFEADSPAGHRLVAGFATASEVTEGQSAYDTADASSPWVLYDVAAPKRGAIGENKGFVGLNLPGANGNYHDVVLVLTRPDLVGLHWGACCDRANVGDQRLVHGLAIWDAGTVRSQVEVSIRDARGSYPYGGFVGVDGAGKSFVPQLAPAAAFDVAIPPASPDKNLGEATGQGASVNQAMSARGTGPATVYARCYGSSSISVAVDGGRKATIRCDDSEHLVRGVPLGTDRPSEGHQFSVDASDLTAWRVAVVLS